MLFFESFLGHYLAQAVVYSLVTVAVVEGMISIWHIHEPSPQIKLRFLALLLPVLCPPLYYLLYPPRNVFYFREHIALIDLNKWLGLPLGGGIAVWHLFAAMLAITTGIFLIKELLPTIKHYLERRPSLPVIEKGQFPKIETALANLSKTMPAPTVLLSPEDTPVAYSTRHRAVVVSAPTIDLLDSDELEAVIAHEVAHLSRQLIGINRVLLTLRFLLFYNPIALLVFRRIINDGEKLCDDIAIRLSGKQLSHTSGLLKMFRYSAVDASPSDTAERQPQSRATSLGNTACWTLIRERVERIMHHDEAGSILYQDLRVAITGVMMAALLFFVV